MGEGSAINVRVSYIILMHFKRYKVKLKVIALYRSLVK